MLFKVWIPFNLIIPSLLPWLGAIYCLIESFSDFVEFLGIRVICFSFLFFQPLKMTEALEILNYIFTAIFGLEMLLKLLGLGPYGYIRDAFNLFDGFIVIMRLV